MNSDLKKKNSNPYSSLVNVDNLSISESHIFLFLSPLLHSLTIVVSLVQVGPYFWLLPFPSKVTP